MAKHIQMPPIYPIPYNWTWVELRQLTRIISGYPFDSKLFSDLATEGRPLIRIRDVVRGYTETYTTEECPEQYIINKNDILIGMDGDFNVGKWQNEDALLNQRVCFIQSVSDLLLNDYLFYFLPKPLKQINDVTPSVTVKHLSIKTIESIMIPLPPLEEQQRIVDRIDSFFAKLDEAKEKAQEVVDNFETRKTVILHKAFSGELTAKWRTENNVSEKSWMARKINQVCTPRAGYAFDSKKFTNAGYQIIRMGNLYGGALDLARNPVFTSATDIDDAILKRSLVNDGDILITLTGTKYKRDYGYAVCIRNPYNLLVNQRILCLSPNLNEITTDYLLYYLQTDIFRDVFFSNETGGVNQGNVSSKFVENIQIEVPTYREQEEIGYILRSILEKEYQAKEIAEAVIEQIDIMKKSILARAFRGELGTNDPSEEREIELLKQID